MSTTDMQPTVRLIARPNIDWNALASWFEDNSKPPVPMSVRAFGTSGSGEALVEVAGRVCYDSYGRGRTDAAKFITNLLEHKDGSVLEHVNYTFAISGISRSLSLELVRHRAGFAYSQRSQRFVDESDCAFVTPPLLLQEGMEQAREQFELDVSVLQHYYKGLIKDLEEAVDVSQYERPTEARKAVRQAARSILPNAAETQMVVTANARAWRHFIEMRGSAFADAEIHRLAVCILRMLQEEAPLLFGDFQITDGVVTTPYSKV